MATDFTKIATEEGKIVAQMVGLSGAMTIPAYYTGETRAAFVRGFEAERARMELRVARATLA